MNRIVRGGALAALVAAVAIALAVPLAGAHEADPPQAATQRVAIEFTALEGSRPVSCGRRIAALGTTSRTAKLTDLRFYVSDLQLLRRGGGAVDVKLPTGSPWSLARGRAAVTLIDLENGTGSCAAEGTKAMNASVRGTVPRGAYTGVRYSVSVPRSLNHTDLTAMPAPLNVVAMAWSWQAGRKFAKVEVSEAPGGSPWAAKTFFLHLGSTDCKGDPAAGQRVRCGLPNRDRVTLARFNPAKQRIALDLKKLFGGVDVAGGGAGSMAGMSMEAGTGMDASGCMSATSSPDCGPIFKALGLRLGGKGKTTQTAFRVVGR